VNDPQKAVRKAAETPLSRRKFVTMIAAGSAALLAQPLASLAATKRKVAHRAGMATAHAKPGAAMPAASKIEKEVLRQRASTLDTLKVIRAHKLPAGSEMAFVFRVMKPSHKERP
jgi:hypothetical protein